MWTGGRGAIWWLGVWGLLVAGSPTAVWGWTPETQVALAREAARLVPPDLYRQLVRNRQAFDQGVREGFAHTDRALRTKLPDGGGRLDEAVRTTVGNAVRSIEAHRPFNEVAYRMGLVAFYVGAANHPLNAANHDAWTPRYRDDYLAYVGRTAPRVARVFYGFRP